MHLFELRIEWKEIWFLQKNKTSFVRYSINILLKVSPVRLWSTFVMRWLIWVTDMQEQLLEVFCKNGILRNFVKVTGKHLCQSLIFVLIKLQSWGLPNPWIAEQFRTYDLRKSGTVYLIFYWFNNSRIGTRSL